MGSAAEPLTDARGPLVPALALLGLLSVYTSPAHAAETGALSVAVVGTEFRVTRADGMVVAQPDLVGMVLSTADARGQQITIRIDGVERDQRDPNGEITLYDLAVRDAAGGWRPLCRPDPDGHALGFPLSGAWTPDGRHIASDTFEIACTSGVIAKCVRAGYKPWTSYNGVPLWDYHQTCVRMFRADYCGDGVATTRDGTWINFEDKLGLQVYDPDPDMQFEAAWGPNGAVCVRKVRIPEITSLDALVRACPYRLAGRVGVACSEEAARASREALILNRSRTPAQR